MQMIPSPITFPGQEIIPGLTPVPNAAPAFLKITGNCPIIIIAPHAGHEDTTPPGAKAFGARKDDPDTGGNFTAGDDTNTLKITSALVRTLSSLGFIPFTVINL